MFIKLTDGSIGRWLTSLSNTFRWGEEDYFLMNISSRYRVAVAPARRLLIGSCALLALIIVWGLGQTILTIQESWTMEQELDGVRQQDHQLVVEASQEGIDLSDAALSRLPAEIDLANQLLEKRTFSWTKFLAGLEQAIPQRLALSSVRLDPTGTMVHLTGTALSLEDITAFTVGLQDHPTFKDPVLAQHRVGANGLVEFDVTVRYKPERA